MEVMGKSNDQQCPNGWTEGSLEPNILNIWEKYFQCNEICVKILFGNSKPFWKLLEQT